MVLYQDSQLNIQDISYYSWFTFLKYYILKLAEWIRYFEIFLNPFPLPWHMKTVDIGNLAICATLGGNKLTLQLVAVATQCCSIHVLCHFYRMQHFQTCIRMFEFWFSYWHLGVEILSLHFDGISHMFLGTCVSISLPRNRNIITCS